MAPIENHEMLKAMYNFEATLAKTLSFNEGDHFIFHQSSTKQRNWWQVINHMGQIGFVPSNYVTIIQVDPHFVLQFLNDCISNLSNDTTLEKQELISQLTEKKQQIENGVKINIKKQAPQPPVKNSDNQCMKNGKPPQPYNDVPSLERLINNSNCTGSSENNHEITNNDRLPNSQSVTEKLNTINKDESKARSPHRSQSSPSMQTPVSLHSEEVLNCALFHMVERVRRETQLSHDYSRIAVTTTLESLKELVSKESCGIVWTLASLASKSGPLPAGLALLRTSADTRKLHVALGSLMSCAKDAQQRGWALHDDNNFIICHLQEVMSILSNADVRVSQDVLSTQQYEYVNVLILYFQMETRWHIRSLLIEVFKIMCTLNSEVVQVIQGSVLPRELARDMLDNPKDYARLACSARLLIPLLSLGDKLPITHFEQLDEYFVSFLLDLIESPPEDEEERVSDLFMTLLLAFDLQFYDHHLNLVLDALESRSDAKNFTEKLLLLFNRENDPVRVLNHHCNTPHSVLKLTLDAVSRRSTASLFYTNDTKVLLDITVRQLADLSAGDQRRGMYLKICLGILRNTDYSHCHRQADLLRCFTRIFCEEGEASASDQALIKIISNEFPQYFKA